MVPLSSVKKEWNWDEKVCVCARKRQSIARNGCWHEKVSWEFPRNKNERGKSSWMIFFANQGHPYVLYQIGGILIGHSLSCLQLSYRTRTLSSLLWNPSLDSNLAEEKRDNNLIFFFPLPYTEQKMSIISLWSSSFFLNSFLFHLMITFVDASSENCFCF